MKRSRHRPPPMFTSLAAGFALAMLCGNVPLTHAEEIPAINDDAIARKAPLPFTVFDEKGSTNNHYIASGWMGNAKAIKADDACANNPHSGKTCLRYEYAATDDWAGIAWQDPANDWGDQPGGWNLTGAKTLRFWARGEKGGESVSFKFGVLGADKKYSDTAIGGINDVKLTKEWKEYRVDLDGKDLSRIKTGFAWSLAGQGAPVIFYLDDIRFE